MTVFMQSPDERRRAWRDFRIELKNTESELDQLKMVAKWWGRCPVTNWSLDWDQPQNWGSPWEVLHDGYYCRNAVAYMMFMTLVLADGQRWTKDRLNLAGIRFQQDITEDQWLVLIVDDRWVLNYSLGEVSDRQHFDTYSRILFVHPSDEIAAKAR